MSPSNKSPRLRLTPPHHQPSTRILQHLSGSLFWLLFTIGCTASPEPVFDGTSLQLPAARVSDDSVLLDIGFLHVPGDDEFANQLWSELDEQNFAIDRRQRLANNGFRIGLVSGSFPTVLRERLDQRYASPQDATISPGESPQTEMDLGEANRRLQLRPGKNGEIVTADRREELVVICHEAGHICGTTFNDAQTMFTIEGYGNHDGSATIELTPEIRHGQSRSRFVGREGAFRLEASRDRKVFDELVIKSRLLPGQTLVISSVGPRKALGGNFFQTAESDPHLKKMVLIRLARSPGDGLFSPQRDEELVGELTPGGAR